MQGAAVAWPAWSGGLRSLAHGARGIGQRRAQHTVWSRAGSTHMLGMRQLLLPIRLANLF
ncbi:hypothetical protein C2845_PM03G25930 [Panicum miliaceum]|uniref:Uncharacterized protein n=1 Tax=Panicum miliaceum TaxID=4540 RepID=A0A3L6T827_PANMI|nr:hypothetical protein C2845_PM03G25930 [Panicum miliaceum]